MAEGANDTFRLAFSEAYVHRSEGRPGIDGGEGYLQPAELVFCGASWPEPLTNDLGGISEGWLVVNGKKLWLVPLPFSESGEISAEIVFKSGAKISISASFVACIPRGDAHFLEKFSG